MLTLCVCAALLAASSTTGPESLVSERDGAQLPGKNPSSWSIDEVMQFVRDADPTALAPHAELFRKHVSPLRRRHRLFVLAAAPFRLLRSSQQFDTTRASGSLSLQEIDGKALMLLRSDMIMKYMGLKLGPALKLCHHIERLKQGKL